ncbi:MAG: phosphotransferase family protein [Steroidobacteraceae bacterium]
MQPDPSATLRGICRDLLERSRACQEAGDALSGVSLARTAELLTCLTLRYEGLPALLHGYQPQLLELLHESIDLLRRLAFEIPADAQHILQESPPRSGDPVVAFHDRLSLAISLCLDSLSRADVDGPDRLTVLRFINKICRAQRDIAHARDAALAAIRQDCHARGPDDDDTMPSTSLLTETLHKHFPEHATACVKSVSRLAGLNANEVFALEVEGMPDWPRDCILRRNRGSDWVGNQVSGEYGVLDHMYRAGLPVPRPLLAGTDLDGPNRPFIILSRVRGRAVRLLEMGDAAASFMRDAAKVLARIHRVALTGLDDRYRHYGHTARHRTLTMVQRYHDAWYAEFSEQSLVLEAAYGWLRVNADIVDERVCVVHADYSQRNILSENGQLTAVLDWELAHVGHPAEDLGYIRPDVEQVMQWNDFLQTYLDAGGFDVDDAVIRYFMIYGLAFQMTTQSVAGKRFMDGSLPNVLIGGVATIEWRESDRLVCELLLRELQDCA